MDDMTGKGLIAGFDLCDDYSQISCCNPKKKEPETIFSADDNMQYRIPTVLYKDVFSGEWSFGYDAIKKAEANGEELIRGFIKDYDKESSVRTAKQEYDKKELLHIYIKGLAGLLNAYYPGEQIRNMTFTVPELSAQIMDDIKAVGETFGVPAAGIEVISHMVSYAYYSLCQRNSLWQRGTGLFEYTDAGLKYYRLWLVKRLDVIAADITSTDLKAYMSGDGYKLMQLQELDLTFQRIIEELGIKGSTSTFYLAGDGFDGEWMNQSLKLLCSGSRVFVGQNLYSRGACYHAMVAVGMRSMVKFKILCEDTIGKDVAIETSPSGRDPRAVIAKAGENYRSYYYSTKVMLKGTDTLYFKVTDPRDGDTGYIPFDLPDAPQREEKTVRYAVDITMSDGMDMDINVKDDGFGIFFEPTDKEWNKRINLAAAGMVKRPDKTGRCVILPTAGSDTPYFMPVSGVRVYTLEELCYYFYNNVYAIDESIFSDDLYYWLENKAGAEDLASGIRALRNRRQPLSDIVTYILKYQGIYDDAECAQIRETISDLEHRNPTEAKKTEGDNYVRYGRYREAISLYTSIIYSIDHDKEVADSVTNPFKGDVYHNLGVAFTRMINYHAAEAAFEKAYALNKREESLQAYLTAICLSGRTADFRMAVDRFELSDEYADNIRKRAAAVTPVQREKLEKAYDDTESYLAAQKDLFRG
ncbi:MAG: tetratricopeptide repeat protein [Lachnospiraceae bacterium]|nr:tetratricopeptide repeat protein [Lachnospiraceae bacterium]